MKVEVMESKFSPYTITIETPAESDRFFKVLAFAMAYVSDSKDTETLRQMVEAKRWAAELEQIMFQKLKEA